MLEDFYVVFRSIIGEVIIVAGRRSVLWPHESNEFAGDYPVQIAVL